VSEAKPFVHRVKPIWRDMDALRHVNNAVYLTYLENTREAYWRAFAGDVEIFPFTLVRVEIDFRASATWRDLVDVKAWVSKFGNASFEFAYALDTADGRHLADAKTVLVMMDHEKGVPVPIGEDLRKRWEAFEAGPR
jgi:acyl-CoA thioester hydrolase